MLETTAELGSSFLHPDSGDRKMIECIRVDGASLRALREKEDEAYSYFLDFMDERGSSSKN